MIWNISWAMLGELLSVCRRIFGLRPNFLKHSQNSHFDCNDPALIHSSTVHCVIAWDRYKACEEAVIIKNDSNTLEKSPFWYMNFKPQYNPEKSRNQLTDSPKKLVKIHRENSADSRIKPYLTEFCDLKMIPAPL